MANDSELPGARSDLNVQIGVERDDSVCKLACTMCPSPEAIQCHVRKKLDAPSYTLVDGYANAAPQASPAD